METSDRTVEFICTVTTMTVIAFCAVFLRLFSKAKYGKEVMLDDNLMVVAWVRVSLVCEPSHTRRVLTVNNSSSRSEAWRCC